MFTVYQQLGATSVVAQTHPNAAVALQVLNLLQQRNPGSSYVLLPYPTAVQLQQAATALLQPSKPRNPTPAGNRRAPIGQCAQCSTLYKVPHTGTCLVCQRPLVMVAVPKATKPAAAQCACTKTRRCKPCYQAWVALQRAT